MTPMQLLTNLAGAQIEARASQATTDENLNQENQTDLFWLGLMVLGWIIFLVGVIWAIMPK